MTVSALDVLWAIIKFDGFKQSTIKEKFKWILFYPLVLLIFTMILIWFTLATIYYKLRD